MSGRLRGYRGRGRGRGRGRERPHPKPGLKNDYNQHFVDTGERPQNFIREEDYRHRYAEFPKLQRLIDLKDRQVDEEGADPQYLQCNLKDFDLRSLGSKFDVILIDPPWEEYEARSASHVLAHDTPPESWSLDEIGRLRIPEIAHTQCFLFLWVGNGRHLEEGRQLMLKWGFRRCEDVVWLKTNKHSTTHATPLTAPETDLFVSSKEHCLLGIRGSVKRKQHGHVIHTNCDTDVITAEEFEPGSTRKPEEMYRIIEHFCLGTRRLELFGEDHNIRRGWLTLGAKLSSSNFNKDKFLSTFRNGHYLETPTEVEELRPKSPEHKTGGRR